MRIRTSKLALHLASKRSSIQTRNRNPKAGSTGWAHAWTHGANLLFYYFQLFVSVFSTTTTTTNWCRPLSCLSPLGINPNLLMTSKQQQVILKSQIPHYRPTKNPPPRSATSPAKSHETPPTPP